MSEFNQARREGKVKFGYDFNSLAENPYVGADSQASAVQHQLPDPGGG